MTRKHVLEAVETALDKKGLTEDPQHKHTAEVAVDAALGYVLEFAQQVSQELVGVGLYSEAMVAGMFVRKFKALISGNDAS